VRVGVEAEYIALNLRQIGATCDMQLESQLSRPGLLNTLLCILSLSAADAGTAESNDSQNPGLKRKEAPWFDKMIYVAGATRNRQFLDGHVSGTENSITYSDSRRIIDDSFGLSFTLGGDFLRSISVYSVLSWDKLEVSGTREFFAIGDFGTFGYTRHTEERGDKIGVDLFAKHRLTALFNLGADFYHEDYDTSFETQQSDQPASPTRRQLSGSAKGGKLSIEASRPVYSVNTDVIYSYSYDAYHGNFFASKDFSTRIHRVEANLDYDWLYNLNTGVTITYAHDTTFDDRPHGLTGPDKSSAWSIRAELKWATTDNSLLLVEYQQYDFDVNGISASFLYNFRGKAPKRRKRNSRLMRVTDFAQ